MIDRPLISIYIPTSNRLVLLKRAIDSILNQSYRHIEIIVVDDGSVDGTWDYLIELEKKFESIQIHRNIENVGACASRNIAINRANGEFITGLDDDDYLYEDHIESLMQTWWDAKGEILAVFPGTIVKTKKNKAVAIRKKNCSDCNSILIRNNIGNQIFTKTKNLKEIDGFDVFLKAWQDLECWYRLLKKHNNIAVYSGRFTYVVDQSHIYDRISSVKKNNINQVYDYFCRKYDLSECESLKLSMQRIQYGITDGQLKNCFSLLLGGLKFEDKVEVMGYILDVMKISILRFFKKIIKN